MLHHVENHIDTMRRKPIHVRRQYALLVSSGVTAIILLVWVTSFGIGQGTTGATATAKKIEVKSPASSLTASVGDAFGYVKDLIFGAGKANYSADNVEVVGGKI